jgi:hypothetical protein
LVITAYKQDDSQLSEMRVVLVLVCIFVGSHEGSAADSSMPQTGCSIPFGPDECIQGSFANLLSPLLAPG